ncbi:hypothetical protein ACET3Z_001322 [Daucus carota]
MNHFSHEHPLILNEDYIARGSDMCNACNEEIVSCKSFVFSCSRRSSITGIPGTDHKDVDEKCLKFLLHKTCAESPRRIQSLRNREEFLDLLINPRANKTFLQTFLNRPGCIMKASRVKHGWDPHPLRLIFDPGMVEDHEHEFQYVMINHVISTSHMSSMVLLILLKTISILTASHWYSTRKFVVAENVTGLVLAGLSLNVHHAKPYSVRPAGECFNNRFASIVYYLEYLY